MDRERVARRVRERRQELGMTQEEVATSGGPSTATLRAIENASPVIPRLKSQRQLENALEWEPGSYRALMRGDEATERVTVQPTAAYHPSHRYADPRLEAIWQITELPEAVRLGMIRFAEGYLADQDERRAG